MRITLRDLKSTKVTSNERTMQMKFNLYKLNSVKIFTKYNNKEENLFFFFETILNNPTL